MASEGSSKSTSPSPKMVKKKGGKAKKAAPVEDYSDSEVEDVQPRRRQQQQNFGYDQSYQQQQQGMVPFGQQGMQGMAQNTQQTMGNVANTALQQQGGGKDNKDTLKLRLDLNLDIEVTLKAKIHGDLELALLDGN